MFSVLAAAVYGFFEKRVKKKPAVSILYFLSMGAIWVIVGCFFAVLFAVKDLLQGKINQNFFRAVLIVCFLLGEVFAFIPWITGLRKTNGDKEISTPPPQNQSDPKREKYAHYIQQIPNPSPDFESFLNNYFTGSSMIRLRNEEDTTVWNRLHGKELSVAKDMILDNLGHDTAYMRAIGIFRDTRGIPLLENFIQKYRNDNESTYEVLTAAKILYDWVSFPDYLDLLEQYLPSAGEYVKTSLSRWIGGIPPYMAERYIFMMLNDENGFVRFCALNSFIHYYDYPDALMERDKHPDLNNNAEIALRQLVKLKDYYTEQSVYEDKPLFNQRLEELRSHIPKK